MNYKRYKIKALRIISAYTKQNGKIGFSILERELLFEPEEFEKALEEHFRLIELVSYLRNNELVLSEGLSISITKKGEEYLNENIHTLE